MHWTWRWASCIPCRFLHTLPATCVRRVQRACYVVSDCATSHLHREVIITLPVATRLAHPASALVPCCCVHCLCSCRYACELHFAGRGDHHAGGLTLSHNPCMCYSAP